MRTGEKGKAVLLVLLPWAGMRVGGDREATEYCYRVMLDLPSHH